MSDEHVLFSIITPVFNTDPTMLRECLDSVRAQSYPWWQLCLVDDASTTPETAEILAHYAANDERISLHTREVNGGIVAASNDALAMAVGDYVMLLDHDDLLDPEALGAFGHILYNHPGTDVVYSDEDKFERVGRYFAAYHKPGWSPEALLAQMYLGHLTAYRRSLVEAVGGFRDGFEGSQDWDLALRVTELTPHIEHIERVLYHWRVHKESTAGGTGAKPHSVGAAERAINEALARRGIDGHVEQIQEFDHGYFQVRRVLASEPKVTVVIPTAGGSRSVGGVKRRLIDIALEGLLRKTDYQNLEVIVVVSESAPATLEESLAALVDDRVSFTRAKGRFDFSLSVNTGVVEGTGELVLMLNDDIDVIGDQWLNLLVEALEDPEVGIVGPRLLFEDGTIQHGGVAHVHGRPFHPHRGQPNGPGYFGEVALTRNYSAVTGACLLTTRELYDKVGGLSPLFPVNYNDIDFCLKIRTIGKRCVYVGQSVLYHYESSSREPSVFISEVENWLRFWQDIIDPDPYFTLSRDALTRVE